jgi:ADP-ribose pyrophosphatase YjhB (NUDIX family)
MSADHHSSATIPARLAVSVVLRRKGRFLLVERANEPGRGMFAYPGGRVETGEQLTSAAGRELMEETGLAASNLREIARFDLDGADGGFQLHVFSTDTFSGVLAAGDDALSADWYSLEQMRVMPVPQSVLEVALTLSELDS